MIPPSEGETRSTRLGWQTDHVIQVWILCVFKFTGVIGLDACYVAVDLDADTMPDILTAANTGSVLWNKNDVCPPGTFSPT